jgi:CO/xanthine dehydrogenase FAD-binding subunit
MVEVNFGYRRPASIVGLRGVEELAAWRREGDEIVLGAGMTWTQLRQDEPAALVPALAAAARTVGSPQIRNAGTLGGNIATASPAGDALPVLYALDATVELASVAGRRLVPIEELIIGVKRTTIAPGELIVAVRVPVARGPQEFLKVGTRNAMVISVCSVTLVVDRPDRSVRFALGAVGPTIIRCTEAERRAAAAVDWEAGELAPEKCVEIAGMVAAAARPIDDHRSTAEYRRRAIEVMARRALLRTF